MVNKLFTRGMSIDGEGGIGGILSINGAQTKFSRFIGICNSSIDAEAAALFYGVDLARRLNITNLDVYVSSFHLKEKFIDGSYKAYTPYFERQTHETEHLIQHLFTLVTFIFNDADIIWDEVLELATKAASKAGENN